jgi:hypothetical protein
MDDSEAVVSTHRDSNANSEDDEEFKPAGNDDSAFVICKLISSVLLIFLSTVKTVNRIE